MECGESGLYLDPRPVGECDTNKVFVHRLDIDKLDAKQVKSVLLSLSHSKTDTPLPHSTQRAHVDNQELGESWSMEQGWKSR